MPQTIRLFSLQILHILHRATDQFHEHPNFHQHPNFYLTIFQIHTVLTIFCIFIGLLLMTVLNANEMLMREEECGMWGFRCRRSLPLSPQSLLLSPATQIVGVVTYRAKLLSTDWQRQRAFFLNHEGTFSDQEGRLIDPYWFKVA